MAQVSALHAGDATRVIKRLLPDQPGERRWAGEFGDRLVCVRYRLDARRQKRQTTVEIVVDEAPTLASVQVGVRVGWAEKDLRQRAKAAGGTWDSMAGLWLMPLAVARQIGLTDRIVTRVV